MNHLPFTKVEKDESSGTLLSFPQTYSTVLALTLLYVSHALCCLTHYPLQQLADTLWHRGPLTGSESKCIYSSSALTVSERLRYFNFNGCISKFQYFYFHFTTSRRQILCFYSTKSFTLTICIIITKHTLRCVATFCELVNRLLQICFIIDTVSYLVKLDVLHNEYTFYFCYTIRAFSNQYLCTFTTFSYFLTCNR